MQEENVTELIKSLKDGDLNVRITAARILSQRDDVAALPALAVAIGDEDASVRELAAGPIVKWLRSGVPFLQMAAATALAKWVPSVPANVLTALKDASREHDPGVRMAADLALTKFK